MVKNNKVLSVRDIAIVAILTAILFVMEQVLSLVPNVQLTVLLLMIFAKKLGILKSSIIILIHRAKFFNSFWKFPLNTIYFSGNL